MRRRRPLLTLWSVKKFWILFEDVGPRLRHTSLAPGNGFASPPEVSRKCSGCFARSLAAFPGLVACRFTRRALFPVAARDMPRHPVRGNAQDGGEQRDREENTG